MARRRYHKTRLSSRRFGARREPFGRHSELEENLPPLIAGKNHRARETTRSKTNELRPPSQIESK